MKRWECTICGYIHEGETPPEECPVCGADSSAFIEVVEETAADQQQQPPAEDTASVNTAAVNESMLDKVSDLILRFHLHPIMTHTPNGIIPLAFLLMLMAWMIGMHSFATAAFYNLVFVLLAMPLVLYTGWVTWQKKYKGAMTSLFRIKIAASLVSTGLLIILVIWQAARPDLLTTPSSARMLFVLLAFLLLGAVGIAGHLGGKLVFGGAGTRR